MYFRKNTMIKVNLLMFIINFITFATEIVINLS
mgnify:CR=1 FL=1